MFCADTLVATVTVIAVAAAATPAAPAVNRQLLLVAGMIDAPVHERAKLRQLTGTCQVYTRNVFH